MRAPTSLSPDAVRGKLPSKRTVADWTVLLREAERRAERLSTALFDLLACNTAGSLSRIGSPLPPLVVRIEGEPACFVGTVYRPCGACPYAIITYRPDGDAVHFAAYYMVKADDELREAAAGVVTGTEGAALRAYGELCRRLVRALDDYHAARRLKPPDATVGPLPSTLPTVRP